MEKLTPELTRRVLAAYFRDREKMDYEPAHEVRETTLKGLTYFYIQTEYGRVQCVYRYIESQDRLKRLKRLPKELKEFT